MKRSEHYKYAMAAVIERPEMRTQQKLEILETLLDEKRRAEWSEAWEEENK